MSRWVVLEKPGLKGGKGAAQPPDGPLARVTKYVPTEVVSAYTVVFSAMVSSAREDVDPSYQPLVAATLILLFCVATIFYVRHETTGAVRTVHTIVSPLAFLAWAYPISSSLLGRWFFGFAAVAAQAIVIALSLILKRAPV